MSKRVNIPRRVQDSHYRYTMAALECKVEGSGNGIYTKLTNLEEIGTDLKRDPSHMLKFFGFELATLTRTAQDNYIVNGKFTKDKLESALDIFIDKYILCGKCHNPETKLKTKSGLVYLNCISCGYETLADIKHKFADFLGKELKKASGLDKKKEKKEKKTKKEEEEEDDASLFKNSTDVSAVKQRKKMLLGDQGSSKEKSVDWKEEFKRSLKSNEILSKEKIQEFRNRLLCSPDDIAKIMVEVCIDDTPLRQVIPFAKRFGSYFNDRRSQRSLINAIVDLIITKFDTLIPKLPNVVKGFYDLDCMEEDVILEWYENADVSDDKVKDAKISLTGLCNWLKEAEEEN